MAEFSIIQRYLSSLSQDGSVVLGIGDDAAVLDCPEGYQLVQTVDTMVKNIHFDDSFGPEDLAHKLLHVNLSDIAAMGAQPKWATVALTLPEIKEGWLEKFSRCLHQLCRDNALNLVGGDTTQGPLSVTLNLTGIVKKGEFITRDGAKDDDDIYVSGSLGDAALALSLSNGPLEEASIAPLVNRLKRPTARLNLGKTLYGIANSCIDLSDGLIADLGHICAKSQCSAKLFIENLPLSDAYRNQFSEDNLDMDYALNGGDDYELCFTVDKSKRDKIQSLKTLTSCDISLVGEICLTENPMVIPLLQGEKYQCNRQGWEHFAE